MIYIYVQVCYYFQVLSRSAIEWLYNNKHPSILFFKDEGVEVRDL